MSEPVVFVGTPFLGEDGLAHGTHNVNFTTNWTWCNRRCVGKQHQLEVRDVCEGTVPVVGDYQDDLVVTCVQCLAIGS